VLGFKDCHSARAPTVKKILVLTIAVAVKCTVCSNDDIRFCVCGPLLLAWFDTAFAILTVNMVLMFVCCILLLICACFAFAARYTPEAPITKDRAVLIMLYVSLFLLILTSKCVWNLFSMIVITYNLDSWSWRVLIKSTANSFYG